MTCDTKALAAVLDKLSPKDQVFAQSLIDQSRRRALSPKQAYWVGELTNRAITPPPAMPTASVGSDLSGVRALFATVSSRLKFPNVRLRADDGTNVKITVAGPRAKVPGSLNVIDTDRYDRYDRRVWYGRVLQDGMFEQSNATQGSSNLTSIIALLTAFAADPAKVAREYGHLTGHCCFCNLPLTDPASLKAGYGPVCAKNWGLPH